MWNELATEYGKGPGLGGFRGDLDKLSDLPLAEWNLSVQRESI